MFSRWPVIAAFLVTSAVVVRSQQYGQEEQQSQPSNAYVIPVSGGSGNDGYEKSKKYQVDTNNDNPAGVESNDGSSLINGWTNGDALTSQQLALLAEKLGGIVVYIFSYLFMASIFVSYIMGVVILMIFKIMFGAFMPVASIELQSVPVYNVTQAPSSGSGSGSGSGSNSYGSNNGGGSASYGNNNGGSSSRYKRATELDELAFGRQARTLMPYTADPSGQFDYMDSNIGLFDRTKAFLNRGYATGRFMFDVLKQPECQKFIMCSTSSTFREERSNNVRFRDMLRQITPVFGRLARSVDDLTQSVNLGAMSGRCHHPTMTCPVLQPAVHKMNELLKYLGVKVN